METLQKIALVFTIIGGITWGLIGLFEWNLVEALFGNWPMLERTIYAIVGISALINIRTLFVDFREDNDTNRR